MNVSYSMLLSRAWLKDAKVSHDWGINLITIVGNGIVRTIIDSKRLDGNTKCLEILCYNFVNKIINEEENILVVTKLDLFTISMMSLMINILKMMIINNKFNLILLINVKWLLHEYKGMFKWSYHNLNQIKFDTSIPLAHQTTYVLNESKLWTSSQTKLGQTLNYRIHWTYGSIYSAITNCCCTKYKHRTKDLHWLSQT